MDYSKLTLIEIKQGILDRKFTSEEVVRFFLEKCEDKKDLVAVVEVFEDAIEKAKQVDEKLAKGESVGMLAGVPVVIKDNILYKDHKCGCASKFMQDFIAPYSATIVERLLEADAVIIGRANMDEFAMGGSCEKSCYGACKNALNQEYVAGGSSGGSAVAVAAGLAPCAIGTDTGGSIRQPASFNGVVGVKPTYGTVSRYGIVAFASSLDQASPICKTVEDCELVLEVIAGKDIHDGTTICNNFKENAKKVQKIGVCKQIIEEFKQKSEYSYFEKAIKVAKEQGYEIVEVDVPHIQSALASYYIIAPAEAASNLSRFDGVKYTTRAEKGRDLNEVYVQSRTEGFGREVKRRIMLGNFVLSSGYFDAYYNKAKKVQKLIRKEFAKAFEECDCILLPTTPSTAFKIGEKSNDPISMYIEDLFTVPANIAGIPAISIPYAKAENGMPLGLQIMTAQKDEGKMFDLAKQLEKVFVGGDK